MPTMNSTRKTRPAPRYQWRHPGEWLEHHIDTADETVIYQIAKDLMSKLDGDQIQDLFQSEMDEAGYFLDLAKLDTAACPDCQTLLSAATSITVGNTEYPTYCETCDREIDVTELTT